MAKENLKKKEALQQEKINQTVSKTEQFFNENKKTIYGALIAILVIGFGILAYSQWILKPKQAEAMEQMGIAIDFALSIEVDDAVIVERMSGRRTCKNCSTTFHIVNNPPKVEGVCDNCGGELSIRKDDAPETVLARLETYHRETEPLKAFYKSRGKLRLAMNQPGIEQTTAEIRRVLEI